MPIITYPEDKPDLGTFSAIDYRAADEEEVDPGIVAELGAAWRQDNTIGSNLNNRMAGINVSERDGVTGDQVWSDIQGTPYEAHWDRFADVFNRRAVSALKSQIDMETEDRRILDAGGLSAVAGQFGMATFDLPSLLPGGSIIRNVGRGVNVGRTALSTGIAGALGAGVSEVALQASQETRPLSDSAVAIGSGAVLGTLLGGGIAGLYSKVERSAAMNAITKARQGMDDTAALDEFRSGLVEGQSAGAASIDRPVLEDYDIGVGAKGIGYATAKLNPLLRAAHSPSAVHRSIMADTAETGFYLERNVRGDGNIAVESAVKFWDRGALSKALTETNSIYDEAAKTAGFAMKRDEFRTAVAKAMRRGDEGDNPAVSQAAKAWRAALFDPLKDQAIEVGLLAPDVSVKTATSYLSRLWNSRRLNAEEGRFKQIVRPWLDDQLQQLEFKADEIRIGNKIVDAERMRETFDKVDERVSGLEGRLAERQGIRQRKTAALGGLRQTRLDMLKERAPKQLVDMLRGADENAVMVQAVKESRAAARSANVKKSFAERQPVLALIKSKGGVRIGSQLDSALRAMDVTPKSHPALFRKKGGIGDLDNFVKGEDDFLAAMPTDDTGMYVDPRDLYEAIRSELGGSPLKSADEIDAEQYLDNIDRVASEWLGKVGLPENASVKDVRGFIDKVLGAERNVGGIDSRVSRLEQEIEEFDVLNDKLVNERDITAAEAKMVREQLDALETELDAVRDLANASPRVSLVVDYGATRRDIFKAKLKERNLAKRVDAIKRLQAEGDVAPEIQAELAAKEIDLGRLRANIEGMKVKANKLEPMVPKVKQEIPEFLSPEDRQDYVAGIVDDVFAQLTGRARQGMPSYDMVMSSRGPMKERTFNIPDHLIEDFLEHDIELIGRRYARVMAADVELARMDKRLGGPGKPDLKGQVDRVIEDYKGLREQVMASDIEPKLKENALLELGKRERSDIEDLAGVRDLLRGQYNVSAQHTNFARVLRVAGTFNYMRSLGGVLAASVTDAVRPAMVNGMRRYMGEGIVPLVTNLKAIKMSVADAKLMGAVTERVLQSRIATMAELADPYATNSPFERLIDNMANTFSKATLLPWWNDMHKSIASVLTQNRILKNAMPGEYAKLDDAERRYMGFVGIDEDMARRVAQQFDEFGQVEGNVHIPGIERWTDEGARRAFAAALNKDVDTTIVTKSVADVPLFLNTPAGRALTQFKSFALASHQRVLMRGMQESGARFFTGTVGMMSLGMLAYMFKQKESGRDLSDNYGTWAMEGLDRSGIFAIAFEINNTWEKLGAPGFFDLASKAGRAIDPNADKRQPASRYANRDAFGALLGPSFQLGTDVAQLLGIPARAMSGDPNLTPADINRMSQMVPFLTLPYWRWFIEGGFGLQESSFKGVEPELKEMVSP